MSRLLREAPVYARQMGPELVAVGVVIDADDEGPARRVQQISEAFARWRPPALLAGGVVGDALRFGIWVCPDNESTGNFDELLLTAAERGRASLVRSAGRLVDEDDELRGLSDVKRRKVRLGIVGQVDSPAGSLVDSARAWNGWTGGAPDSGPLAPLCVFIDELTRTRDGD